MTQTLTGSHPATSPASREDLNRLIALGRELQAEAMRDAFCSLFRYLIGGCSLRVMRLAGPLPGQRQSCC